MARKRKQVTVADHQRLQFTRWVLFALVANEAAGLPPVTRPRLHSLLFMSFAASCFYGIAPLRQRARRTEHGPYYRWAHIAMGGLTLSGLVEVSDFQSHPKARDLQFEGVFQPTLAGLQVARVLRETRTGATLYRFLLDLCLAAARTLEEEAVPEGANRIRPDAGTQGNTLDRVLAQDLTYRAALRWHSDSLEHQSATEESTPTMVGLAALGVHLQRAAPLNRKDILSAYQTVLLQRTRRSA